uniref:Phosphoinositide phospholipase C n=1 Tax=Amazona collaria TaxID=241587 RepID=A0A8B9G0Y8_9PSIT
MSSMQTGTQMIKLRGSSKGLVRFYYLDEHKSCIRWRPSRKNEKAKISIDSIQEVCEGKQSEIFQRYADGSFDPNCCFSIYYGDHMESLDLVSSSGEEARTWITGLKYLMAGISDEDSLSKHKNGDGSLSINEVLQLMHKLNVNLPRQKVKQMFKEADTDDNQGTLDFDEFCAFYKMMSTRRDLYLLMLTYSNHKDHLDADDLRRFLETEQKMTNVTKEHCLEIINKFEPCLENKKEGALGIDGFTNYMRSPSGDIFNPEHYRVNQDMSYPLSHYFITSSHNTYLMGDQLMSQSRVDMYAWVLQSGCRCVEVDCWDGPDGEPIVHHGYTLTSKILFKDVIETINKYAFIKNEYPVILSIENHCSVIQQKKMAQYLTEILGDKLDLSSVHSDDSTTLPSPASLKGKILVKGKKLPANISDDAEEGEVSDEDSADEIDDDCKLMNGDVMENIAKKKLDSLIKESKIRDCEDLNNFTVTTLPSGKTGLKSDSKKVNMFYCTSEDLIVVLFASGATWHYYFITIMLEITSNLFFVVSSSWQVSSFSETKAHQILQQKPAQYLRFNQHQLSRIYPSSYRVDSSNYNPQPFWNAGCQLVALNYQSEGRMLQLNRAKFSANGNCGYVLKPNCMCQGVFNPNSEDPLPGQLKKQLVLRIISGQQLPKPRDSMLGDRGEIIDPFVEVEVIGLPVDCFKEQTRVVDDNGFNPMWEETLVFTVHMPEIALIRFLVWDHDPIGRDFIGQRTIAFSSMMPGYRHVYLEGIEEASIFVHVAINDICGKAKQALGLRGLFLRNPKQASLDSHAAGQLHRKHSFSSHILRRTASAPTKSQKKNKKGFPEIAFDTKDDSSEGVSEDHEVDTASQPRFEQEPESAPLTPAPRDGASGEVHGKGLKGKAHGSHKAKSQSCARGGAAFSEPIQRSDRVRLQEHQSEKQSVFARCAISSSGRIGVATNCMKCMIGSQESPDLECQWSDHPTRPIAKDILHHDQYSSITGEERLELKTWGVKPVKAQPRRQAADLQSCGSPGTGDDLEFGQRYIFGNIKGLWCFWDVIRFLVTDSGFFEILIQECKIPHLFDQLNLVQCLRFFHFSFLVLLFMYFFPMSALRLLGNSQGNGSIGEKFSHSHLPADELCPRPLARGPQDAFSSIPRRHTWSRLYIESLRQSSNKSKAHDMVGNNQAKSKSLGDLTSDDIVCTFESKYRSISRSFVTRSMREQRRSSGLRSSVKSQDELTEQLKKLTAFQQENDITSPISLDPSESEEEGESVGLLRRSSSRSQSRVRYIANRAKQAQERQRLQSLGQLGASPIEERGNPEGACSVAKAVCMDAASPAMFTSQPKNQTDYNTDTEVFFMLKL